METMPINNTQDNQFQPVLFIPVKNVITDNINHDGTFWGIRFPVLSSSFHQAAINVIEEYLENSRDPVLEAALQGFHLAAVVYAVIVKIDRESVKHKLVFWY